MTESSLLPLLKVRYALQELRQVPIAKSQASSMFPEVSQLPPGV